MARVLGGGGGGVDPPDGQGTKRHGAKERGEKKPGGNKDEGVPSSNNCVRIHYVTPRLLIAQRGVQYLNKTMDDEWKNPIRDEEGGDGRVLRNPNE